MGCGGPNHETENLTNPYLYFLYSDHQQLAKLIQESPTVELKDNLECELEALVGRMEAKANQITKVRKYQAQVTHTRFPFPCCEWFKTKNEAEPKKPFSSNMLIDHLSVSQIGNYRKHFFPVDT